VDKVTNQQVAARAAATQEKRLCREIRDAQHRRDPNFLGILRRVEDQHLTEKPDATADAVFERFGHTWHFFAEVFDRNAIDDQGSNLIGLVHFGQKFANAFWDGQKMAFGDGDGEVLGNFAFSLDVVAHELVHGITQHTSQLLYNNQSGALNESISDVFASMVKQWYLKEDVNQADWLIGEEVLYPQVRGLALRSMKKPGSAYNDPKLGPDPQPSHMDNYLVLPNTREGDYGGVHFNSGIPNHAFYLVATAFGGRSWDKAGPIWYATILAKDIKPNCTFAEFAHITIREAKQLYDHEAAEVVRKAWKDVGVHAQE
jgi:Zn-dependent metalloprotease